MAGSSNRSTESWTRSDEALMIAVAARDTSALEQLYTRHSRVAYGLALRILANAEQAEEVVQEAFWRVWNRAATFESSAGQFTAWLFGIVRNLCLDELRRRQARPLAVNSDDQLLLAVPDPQPDIESIAVETERRRLISDMLAELPPDQRQVIELAYFGGLTQREIADKLNNPLGTVKTRIRLALQKLKGLLQQHGIGQDD